MPEKNGAQLSLSNILDKLDVDAEDFSQDAWPDEKAEGWDEEDVNIAKEGYCIECEGGHSNRFCSEIGVNPPLCRSASPGSLRSLRGRLLRSLLRGPAQKRIQETA